jgi:hypothetical protein
MRFYRRTPVCARGVTVLAAAFAAALSLLGSISVSPASAALPTRTASWWHLEFSATPTNLTPGKEGAIFVTVTNLGDETVNATTNPVTITDQLPAALRASVTTISPPSVIVEDSRKTGAPTKTGALTCTLASASCTFNGTIPPYGSLNVRILMQKVPPDASGENEVTVTGGGPLPVSLRSPVKVSDAPTGFGVENYELKPEGEEGALETQAGAHPFQLTTTVALNNKVQFRTEGGKEELFPQEAVLARDLDFKWPKGLIGNPTVLPHCTDTEFAHLAACPAGSVVGVAIVHVDEPLADAYLEDLVDVFNLEPEVGEPARFGFIVGLGTPVYIDTSVRAGGDYGITVSSSDISEEAGFLSATVMVWGVPGDPRHGLGLEESHPPAFLSLPTSCAEPMQTSIEGDSWADPGNFTTYQPSEQMGTLTGCNHLPFSPEIKVAPDGQQASKPSGLTVDVHVPQEGQLNATGLTNSNIKDIHVILPEDVALNPAGANELEACSEGLIGYLPGESNPPSELHFTPKLPGSFGSSELFEPGLNFCPNASKIGTVKIKTPLLPNPLEGTVYLAAQNANPFGSLVAMYIVAEDPVSGSLVKLPGDVSLNEQTGQIEAMFENTPQLAFEDAELHFFGGERAPLATPAHCGTYTTNATFTPWSGNPPAQSQTSFQITSGTNGGACPGARLPFSPSLTGGATNIQAGAFSPFTLTMSRKDGEQNMQSVEAHLPPGLSGVLSNVELCPEPQADLGECPANSLIGETTVSVGVGGDPYTVSGGRVYLTGPYNGNGPCTVGTSDCAPFGLTFEVPAKAGPFDLKRNSANPAGEDACDCVIVRGKIEINPLTAALTITSDPPGSPYAIPTSIEGIPLEIQHINATTTRSNFQFNPTSCNKMEVTGTIDSSEGSADTIAVPFQVTNCKNLNFTPKFTVSTNAHTSKANGASLTAKVTEPAGSLGAQANLARVKVELPKQLPSRLTTLQKACTAKQFDANSAGCPPESDIGHATVHTPLLSVPLTGPAIFVSHGGEAFPSLTMVLQGDGVTIDLVGATFISKAGVTSTTFKTVPDQPFSTFELTLPTGRFSALTGLGNLCAEKLTMPTEFVGQNGAEIHEVTKVGVTDCKKTKTLTRAQKLKMALKACHKKHSKHKREACEHAARRQYGPLKKIDKKKS